MGSTLLHLTRQKPKGLSITPYTPITGAINYLFLDYASLPITTTWKLLPYVIMPYGTNTPLRLLAVHILSLILPILCTQSHWLETLA